MQVIGQQYNLDIINAWKEMPNFTIIQGDKNTGKTHLVFYMCEKFNLHYVKMKNGINDVRQLIKLMSPNSNTIYHFKDFDKASLQAKNALLKITEETPVGNHIVITGSRQIKTLESRARKITMSAYSLDDIVQYSNKYNKGFEIQKKLYIAGINTPSKIDKYINVENLDGLVNLAFDTYSVITNLTIDYCCRTLALFEGRYTEVNLVLLYIDMLIHIIEYNIVEKHFYDYFDILNILIQTKESIERDYTLNNKFALYRTLYSIGLLREKPVGVGR